LKLKQYFCLLRRWAWLIEVCILVGGGAACVAGQRVTPVYEASSTLRVSSPTTQGASEYTALMAGRRLAQTYDQLLTRDPGLVAWLSCLMLVVATAWQVYRRGQQLGDGWLAGLGAGLLGSQAALVVHGLSDATTWGMVRTTPLVWALWGPAMAAVRVRHT
jgi:hypothetical protein